MHIVVSVSGHPSPEVRHCHLPGPPHLSNELAFIALVHAAALLFGRSRFGLDWFHIRRRRGSHRAVRLLVASPFSLTKGNESSGTLPNRYAAGAGEQETERPWRRHNERGNVKPRPSGDAVCAKPGRNRLALRTEQCADRCET